MVKGGMADQFKLNHMENRPLWGKLRQWLMQSGEIISESMKMTVTDPPGAF